jgi:heme-degrading monooxygenase HmoA
MIARYIQVTVKPERINEFRTLYENEILPILQRQSGFLDEISLVMENKTDRHVTLTLWKTKADVENYNRREYPRILEMLKPFMTGTPTLEYFTVEHTTFRKVDTVAA